MSVLVASYDWGSSDFGQIAASNNEPFNKAIKDRTKGDELLNTLFRFGMLVVDDVGDYELEKLANEWSNLGVESISGDDAADATRYGIMPVPWEFSEITKEMAKAKIVELKEKTQLEQRRGGFVSDQETPELDPVTQELLEWGDMYG